MFIAALQIALYRAHVSFRVLHILSRSREVEVAPTTRGTFKNNRKYGELNNPCQSKSQNNLTQIYVCDKITL